MKIIYATNCDEIMVSDCDLLFLAGYNWTYGLRDGYYHCSNCDIWNGKKTNGKHIHWFVAQLMGLEIPEGLQIDHIDRDPSNNQQSNLRAASRTLQNYNVGIKSSNTSGYVGVSFKKCREHLEPWVTQIRINGISKHLGCFKTAEEASEAYQVAKLIRDAKEEQRVKEICESLK